ncbi:MAG: pantetheine-phosphate adenylyltransferase [Bacilli bacterium]|nr:pantetheine-phosphate adenylyltransferase [Bacilli bacterium]
MNVLAIYPGSFDPITNGHIDIVKRALRVFDKIIILVAVNPGKKYLFSVEERVQMIKDSLKEYPQVSVDSTSGLTVHYAQKVGANAMIRGLRAATDFEYEFQMNNANVFIDKQIESIFFMAKHEFMFISSSTIKEMVAGGIDVSKLVPAPVYTMLKKHQ